MKKEYFFEIRDYRLGEYPCSWSGRVNLDWASANEKTRWDNRWMIVPSIIYEILIESEFTGVLKYHEGDIYVTISDKPTITDIYHR